MAHTLSAQSVEPEHKTIMGLQRLNVVINLHPRLSSSVLFVGNAAESSGILCCGRTKYTVMPRGCN